MTPETKVVGLAPIRIHRQEPIPWCTTHDRQAIERDHGLFPDECWVSVWTSDNSGLCTISTGGPDHFWWKDV